MPLRALLMRLFLSVALLANGPGIAGVSMHVDHLRDSAGGVTSVPALQTPVETMAACHGAATAPVADDHRHPPATELADADSPLGDCCQAGDCCACMQHCFAAIADSTLGDFSMMYRHTAEPFLSAHASAALTNLFRPPIA